MSSTSRSFSPPFRCYFFLRPLQKKPKYGVCACEYAAEECACALDLAQLRRHAAAPLTDGQTDKEVTLSCKFFYGVECVVLIKTPAKGPRESKVVRMFTSLCCVQNINNYTNQRELPNCFV